MRRFRRADRPLGSEEMVLSRQRNEAGVTVHNLRRQRQRVDDQVPRFPEGTQQPGPPQPREIVSVGVACIHLGHAATLVSTSRLVLSGGKRSATRIQGHHEALAGAPHPVLLVSHLPAEVSIHFGRGTLAPLPKHGVPAPLPDPMPLSGRRRQDAAVKSPKGSSFHKDAQITDRERITAMES